ncbi:hypothetical protein BKA64DRAFT_439548 [Cadophora sp. MPI-SDFR-AT-0126]|nr:hypothetical protein BKA64DRAFT_439548 [Leotiomycetes sp. MPI-SDFR-AT-0126]
MVNLAAFLTLFAITPSLAVTPDSNPHDRGCITPTGIDDETPGALSSANFQPLDVDNIINFTIALQGSRILSRETPIQFQLINSASGTFYAVLASYEPKALDPWGRVEVMNRRRRCKGSSSADEALFHLHRSVTMAYNSLYLIRRYTTPDLDTIMSAEIDRLGLDSTKCKNDPSECDDNSTPWGLAYAVINDTLSWFSRDGWNKAGKLAREFNPRPYQDWRDEPYHPVNPPWDVTDKTRWTPLLEDNKLGYLFHQTHVVSHIGQTGKTMYVSNEEHCRRTLEDPKYDLQKELNLALERSSRLDDKSKMEIEYFDSKVTSLPPLLDQYWNSKNVSAFERRYENYALNSAIYEATLLSWRLKIEHDLIRPTTVAQQYGVGKVAKAFAGPGAGIQDIPVDQWEPYIRTMPHSEFPSGSSCFCEVFREYVTLVSGKDDVDVPLVAKFAAGSSKVEPGITPSEPITLSWSKWSDVYEACAQSRLNGGVHFSASIPAGRDLCSGLAKTAREAVLDLVNGRVPKHVTPFDSPLPSQKRCKQRA